MKTLIDAELRSILCGDQDGSIAFNMETDQDESNSVVPSIPSHENHGGPSNFPSSSFDKITVFEASPKGVRSSKLETVLKCHINIVNAIGSQFQPFVDDDFVEAILNTLQHPNRFVREVGFLLCSVLLDSGNFN